LARTAGSVGVETAQRVREAALKLFAARGFAAVSMREIAGEVGVQAAALYNHFPNKQALLADLMRAHMEELLAAWDANNAHPRCTEAALERFARFHIRFHAGRSDAVFISYMELRSLEPDNFRQVEKHASSMKARCAAYSMQALREDCSRWPIRALPPWRSSPC
jgi:AcrR family transcriptional regulator